MNRKAITLSVNFLVIIILSIVIISFSVYILTAVVGKAGELSKMTQEDLDKRIETLQCSGQVCFAVNYKVIERGEFGVFGLKIFTKDPGNFKVNIEQVPGQYELSYQPKNLTFSLRGNDEKRIGIGIEVPENVSSGLYIFNVNVEKDNTPYPPPQQIRVEVP